MHDTARESKTRPADWIDGAGGGEMGRRVRALDWSQTPLGPIESWPADLRMAVGICLNSRFPMFVWWGPELVNLYNDAYAPVLGQRHPDALGRPARDIWGDIWPVLAPQVEGVMERGEATWNDRVRLLMERNGYAEETYFTWSYSPIPGEAGGIAGLFCACTEETATVFAERERDRLAGQRQLALDAAGMGWWHLDPLTGISTWDVRYAAIFGVSGSTLPNERLLALIHPDDLPAVLAAVGRALDPAVREPFHAEYRINRHDGLQRRIEARGLATFEGEGVACRAATFVGTVDDVTERRANEGRLRTSEERMALAVAAGGLGTFYCPMPMGEILWNDTCKAHFWLSPDAAIDFDRFYAILHPDDLPATRAAIERSIFEHQPYDIEYRTVAPDGRFRWIRARGRAFYDDKGEPTRFDGVTLDITDRKTAEQALRDSEHRFRDIADAAPAMLWITEPDGVCTFLSRGWYEFTGQTEATGLGIGWTNAVHPDDFANARDRFLQANAARSEYAVDFRVRRADGVYRWVIDAGRPRFAPDGAFLGHIGSVIDIDDRKRAEDRSTAILESITEAFFAIDHDWRFTYVNRQADELLGRTPGDLLGKSIWDEFPGLIGSPFEPLYRATARNRVTNSLTAFYPDHQRYYEVHLYPAVEGISIYFRDVTDRRQTEIELQHVAVERERVLQAERLARAEAERAGQMKDEFLATLSHELRTPLNAILGWAQIMKLGPQSPDDLAQGLDTIERNARAQTQIIEDLLDMSRIISGKVRLDVQPLELADVVNAAVETVRPAALAKGIRLQTVLDPLAHPVAGDPGRLQQVFWNLLSNAIKFTPKGGRVLVRLERVNSHLELAITDTGEGIAAEFLPFVFDRFRQADSSTTRRYGGLGLGLAIVKQLVELHGGSVRVNSPGTGMGTTFIVVFPLNVIHHEPEKAPRRHPDSAPVELPPAAVQPDGLDATGIRVLVVDDEPDARGLVRRVLEDRGAVVTTAASVREALECLRNDTFDVLVSDVGMPNEDGYTLIRETRALPGPAAKVPAIALTAYARAEDRVKSIVAGFNMHITKPVEPAELLAMVASLAGCATA